MGCTNLGGRGNADGMTANVPKMNNPAGIPKNAMTEDEFLGLRGVGFAISGWSLDKLRSNKTIRSQNGQKRFQKEGSNAEAQYQAARNEAKQEYKSLVEKGVIRDKTPLERRLTTAHGNPGNESTQAARRLLDKKGIDWKTGKKKKK